MITLNKNSLKYKDSDGNMRDSGVLFASDGENDYATKEELDQLSEEIVDLEGVTAKDITALTWQNLDPQDNYIFYMLLSYPHYYPNQTITVKVDSGYKFGYKKYSDKECTNLIVDAGYMTSQEFEMVLDDAYYSFFIRRNDYKDIKKEEGDNCSVYLDKLESTRAITAKEYIEDKKVKYYPKFLIPSKSRIVMHRGASNDAPENTIPAFELAGQNDKVFGIECDVRCTSDGHYVIMHDTTVDRTTNGTGEVHSLTYEQIASLTIDGGKNVQNYPNLKVPTLAEYLNVCHKYGKVAVIELEHNANNPSTFIEDIVNIVKECDMERSCIFISFYRWYFDDVRKHSKLIHFMENVDTSATFTDPRWFSGQIDGFNFGLNVSHLHTSFTEEKIKSVHNVGGTVGVWSVNDQNAIDNFKNMGVDIITTDVLPTEDKVGITPQTFTDEQKAQARANIGVRDEGVYELIDTITLTEDASLDLSAEPDGTPYAFVSLFIKANVKVGTGEGEICYNFQNSTSEFGRAYITAPTSKEAYYVIEMYLEKGRWVGRFGGSTNGSVVGLNVDNYNRAFELLPKSYGYNYIRRVFTKFTFATGSTFKIYAIRYKGV